MTDRKKFTLAAAALLVIAGSTLGAATAASASTLHGNYKTKADCVKAEGIWESHGYRITQPCIAYQPQPGSGGLYSYTFWTA